MISRAAVAQRVTHQTDTIRIPQAMKLEKEKRYRPYKKGVYQVAPLLRPMPGAQAGDCEMDQRVFQICENFPEYRASKERSLKDNPEKYIGSFHFEAVDAGLILDFIINKLCLEYPHIFSRAGNLGREIELQCKHSQETIRISQKLQLLEGPALAEDPFTALALQFPEDFAVWKLNEHGRDWMAYGSILSPNHWDPRDKIGQNFFAVHQPIAESGPMLKNSAQIVRSMIHNGPFLRFAWGIATDTQLNHHPEAPIGVDRHEWLGRDFDPDNPRLWVRCERQTLHGFPEVNMSFFTIRTFFEDVHEIKKDLDTKLALKSALLSMTKSSLEYKGLNKNLSSILEWIDT